MKKLTKMKNTLNAIIFYLLAAGLALFVSFVLPEGSYRYTSFSLVFFAMSSLAFLAIAVIYAFKEIDK